MIEARGLTMHYGPVKALQDATFSVSQKEIVGLVGPNGAGKSTTMKILTTYLYPSGGSASVAGYDVLENPIEVRKRIGYLPEVLPLYTNMEVRAYLDFVGRARGLRGKELKGRCEWVVEKCGLELMYRKLVHELSKGYKQRTGLAQALIHDPEVVILDEPTSGLDPHQILEIRSLVRELAEEKTVLLSTHILQEVEAMADRIIIINRGRIVGDGTLAELQARAMGHSRGRITLHGDPEKARKSIEAIEELERVDLLEEGEGRCTFEVEAPLGASPWKELGALAKKEKWLLEELGARPFTLEETFLALTEAQVRKTEIDSTEEVEA